MYRHTHSLTHSLTRSLTLNVIFANSICLSHLTQYCNGGDLADYLQGKHHTNLCDTCAHTAHQNKVTIARGGKESQGFPYYECGCGNVCM